MEKQGRQTPTDSFIIPYKETRGEEAAELYAETGQELLEWQKLLLYDIMAVNEDGLWVHQKFGYSVSRRNGKSEGILALCLWAMGNNLRILYTAHRTSTSHAIWSRLSRMYEDAGIEVDSSMKAFGKEHLYLSEGGAIEFRTRTSSGGLGEGYDLLIVDEAQEYTEAQETSLKYVVSDSKNPMTVMLGTPPTVVSAGTVFMKFRDTVLSGRGFDAGWAEWSVRNMTDPEDVESWYETNPSLGTILTERKIRSEITTDDVDFNIQRLGLWLKYNQKSAISKKEWEAVSVDALPEFKGKIHVGIKYAHDGEHVALSVAVKTADKKIFVECIDVRTVREGTGWIIQLLSTYDYSTVTIDGANGQQTLQNAMKDAGLKKPKLPTVKEIISANALFEQNLFGNKLCHNNQPSLTQSVSNVEKRAIGSNGGFGYRSIKEKVDVCLMESMILAQWQCAEAKDKKKQRIRC